MSKSFTSVIGVDLGTHTLKSVCLSRKGNNNVVLQSYAVRHVGDRIGNSEQLSHHLKLLLKDLGKSAKGISVASSDPEALMRIIEQPPTPVELLRQALKLNGMSLLNQDCREYILDCDLVQKTAPTGANQQLKYLIVGLPRTRVSDISEGFKRNKQSASSLQIADVALLNAFEYARPEVFRNETYMLLDIGHSESSVLVGSKGELVLARSIDYGGKTLLDMLTMENAIDRQAAITLVEQGDAGMAEAAQVSLATIARELRSSIGFVEGQREETITRLFVSGGPARSAMLLQILSDQLNMACELWDPFDHCENTMSKAKKQSLQTDFATLNVAFGAALELLLPS